MKGMILLTVTLLFSLVVAAMPGHSKNQFQSFNQFVPQTKDEEAILQTIKDFQKSTNEEDKALHFSLFAQDATLTVSVGGSSSSMKGKEEIIAGTPWTGTRIEIREIKFGKIKGTKAKAKTKNVLYKVKGNERPCIYDWEFVFSEGEGWKIKKLRMKL